MKKKALLSLGLATSLFLAACGGNGGNGGNGAEGENGTDENGATAEAIDPADLRIGMVADMGGIDDRSFNQSTWEGLNEFAEEHGLEVGSNGGLHFLASATEADYLPNLTQFAENGWDLTFGVGFLLEGAIAEVAAQFPDSHFALIDSVVNAPNVASITFEEHVGSFLVGVAAAMTTETNTVGFVGGVDGDLINRFEVGFRQGVLSVNPDIEILVQYAGSFNDAAAGASIAATMYESGADVIYHAAGGTGMGVFTEARNRSTGDNHVWVIGVDRDQHEQGMPENVTLTSMLKRVDVAARDMSTKFLNGEFPGGETVVYGLAEDGIGVAPGNLDAVNPEILPRIEQYRQQILDGEIEVVSTHDEFDAWLAAQ